MVFLGVETEIYSLRQEHSS